MTEVHQSAPTENTGPAENTASMDNAGLTTTAGSSATDRERSAWTAFRDWRRSRPFWAGVFAIASGLLVLFPPFASLKFGDVVVTLNTFSGITALVIGVVVIACGVSFWAQPQFRFLAGVVTLLLALAAIVTANLGTFLIGTLLGILGSALGIAWSPEPKKARRSRRYSGPVERNTDGGPKTHSDQNVNVGRYADVGGRV